LDIKNKKYLTGILCYDKVLQVYPSSALCPKAKRQIADVYADSLKKPKDAIAIYQEVVNKYPGSDEAGASYGRLAQLSEQEKQYSLAIEVYDKMIELYPQQDAAYNAYVAKARVYKDSLKDYKNAVNSLEQLAGAFKGEKGVKALNEAALIASKDMRDTQLEIKLYQRISTEYADDTLEAPKALYSMAEVYDKKLKNPDRAVEIYRQIADGYAASSYAAKANKMIEKLTAR
jgi:tetratricopeptide (TPR) repeat protein